ncbi:hypothetical protein PtB15_7B227 [Puccinia triticina]|nr:hypothetical protein PtB15_7B227 [Puccinia triticina]
MDASEAAKLQQQLADITKKANDKEEKHRQAKAKLEDALRTPNPPPPPTATKTPKIAQPDKFNGEHGAVAETFARQVGIYMTVNKHLFPTNTTQILFVSLYMTGPAGVWAAPFLDQAAVEPPTLTYAEFTAAFRGMFFDPEKKAKAERALQALKQTGSVADYTHTFVQHASAAGWEIPTLLSQYRQGLKRDIQMALIVSRTTFTTINEVATLALELDTAMSGAEAGTAPAKQKIDPDAMDLSALNRRLSDSEKARMMREGLCFQCGAQGHISRDCPTKKGKGRGNARIAAMEDQIRQLVEGMAAIGGGGPADKGGKGRADSATPQNPLPPASFLIDSGATHDVLSKSYAAAAGLLRNATASRRTVLGFDGSTSRAAYEIDLTLNEEPRPSKFIITRLKDTYDGILGMPWIRKHGHQIDWTTRTLRSDHSDIAAASAASSTPKTSSTEGQGPMMGKARIRDEGVCVLPPPQCEFNRLPSSILPETAGKLFLPVDSTPHPNWNPAPPHLEWNPANPADNFATALAVSSTPQTSSTEGQGPMMGKARICDKGVCILPPPQCESDKVSPQSFSKAAGKPISLLELYTAEISAAKTLWSTSARLAAAGKAAIATQTAEELVPQCYHRFIDMFRKSSAKSLPPRRKYDFRVDLVPGATPQASRIIPLSPAENQALDTLIAEGLASGTIRRTTSPWAAPVLFTGKKDGNLRPCFDYRKLNALTVKNRYPLPLTMDLVDSLLDADTFTKLDLRNAYGNLQVAEGDEDKLAFICKAGQFAPLTMPFGPTGAPGYFQYFMQDILLGRIGKDTAAYLDDIMVYTQKGSNHTAAVNGILETLSKHQLWLKPEKCEFSKPEVEYLGILIACNRIRMDPAKVKAVTEWPAPRNVTELQRFIGFSNFYRRFIDHFSGKTRPLHDLTKAKTPFVWDDKCNSAFECLKTAFTSAPILKIADPYKPFILECDCSDFALGAVLSQVCNKDKELHPVAYLSQSLVQAEKNYKIFDKELLAIVAAFKEWRQYLEGNLHRLTAIVYTDHRNLESFMTTKELTRRQARWAETMGCFDFEIIFRPGRQATKPDALSRRPDLAPAPGEKLTFGQLLKPNNITERTFAEISEFESWFEDESIDLAEAEHLFEVDVLGIGAEHGAENELAMADAEIIARIRELTPLDAQLTGWIESLKTPTGNRNRYTETDGILYDKGRIVVPADPALRTEILKSRHDTKAAGHPGRSRTLALVRRSFVWNGQKKFVNQYVDGCDSCQRVKALTQQPFGTLEPLPIPAGPWTDISYDLITDLPESRSHDSILTVVDRLTKMAHFIPCRKSMNAEQLADLMAEHVWKLHSTPKTIVSDRGSIFVSQITLELDNRLGIRLQPSTVYHPRTDGQSEIANKADDWAPLLATAEFAYNNNDHMSTGVSPFKANYGFNPLYSGIPLAEQCVPAVAERLRQLAEVQDELKHCLEAAQEAMKSQFDRGVRKTPEWNSGDEGVHPVFHVSVLRKHKPNKIAHRQRRTPEPVTVNGGDEWEVDGILDSRWRGRTTQYLVSWRGFGPAENSWEPEENLKNSGDLVAEFNSKFPEAAARHRRTRRRK